MPKGKHVRFRDMMGVVANTFLGKECFILYLGKGGIYWAFCQGERGKLITLTINEGREEFFFISFIKSRERREGNILLEILRC